MNALGNVWLPSMVKAEVTKIPISTVAKIGIIGPYHADMNGKASDGSVRGPFEIRACSKPASATYPVLWAMEAEHQSVIAFDGDSEGVVKAGSDNSERDLIKRKVSDIAATMSHCHFNRDFRFNSQALSMQFSPRPTIGGRSWLGIKLPNEIQEKALVLWANTSIGLLLHWWHSNKNQPGRSTIGKAALEWLPTLATNALSDAQLKEVDKIFPALSNLTFKPMHEIDVDDNRTRLDEEFLCGVLAVPKVHFAPHGAFTILKAKLSAEPSIRGQK